MQYVYVQPSQHQTHDSSKKANLCITKLVKTYFITQAKTPSR